MITLNKPRTPGIPAWVATALLVGSQVSLADARLDQGLPEPSAPAPTPPVAAEPAPAAFNSSMHCAITQYQQWARAQATPPDAQAKANKLQEINENCGTSLRIQGVSPTSAPSPAPLPATAPRDGKGKHTKKSMEVVSSVLISADDSKLVVMTDHFHYIFDLPAPLLAAIQGTFHPYVHATFSDFHVDIPGAASGTVSLAVSSPPPEALASAIAAGFTKVADGAVFATTLHGYRYYGEGIHVTQQYKLNQTYQIEVEDDLRNYKKPSPIMMAAGYLTIYGILLVVAPQEFTSR